MTNDITNTTSAPTLTLEECDASFERGVLLIRDAVLNYARHGLTPKEIGIRVRGLGASESDRTIRRWVGGFRAEKLLPEKEKVQTPDAIRMRATRERTNGQNGQMFAPQPAPLTTTDPIEVELTSPTLTSYVAPVIPEGELTSEDYREMRKAGDEWLEFTEAAMKSMLRNYGEWHEPGGFFPWDAETLIHKYLNDLNNDQLKVLREKINSRITPDFIDV